LLASAPCAYEPGQRLNLKVTLLADRITVALDGQKVLAVRDATCLKGKIGLRADGPARYGWVRVTATEEAAQRIATNVQYQEKLLAAKQEEFGTPRLVHKVEVNNLGNYFHLADFTGEGKHQIAFIGQQCLGPDQTRITQIGMMDLSGKVLWKQGEMLESCYPFHSDVPFNFGDIDGDGKAELLIVQDNILRILDSSTGEAKQEMPVPKMESGEPMFSDSILLADLSGKGRKSDILLKDRYTNIWAFDSDLQPLWHRTLNTGHFPRAFDINGDGREEVMAGYSMLTADGETMWTVPGADPINNVYEEPPHSEHADSIWLGRPDGNPDSQVQVVIAASDMGLLVLDAVSGELLQQEPCGHAQSLGIARFRPDLPGYQIMVSNLWGNAGLTTLCDSQGRKLVSREFRRFGIMLPLNWRNDGTGYVYNWNIGEVYDRDLDMVHTFEFENEAGYMARPFVDDFLGLGADQVICASKDTLEFYAAESVEGSVAIARHDTENFNSYGAFFLESLR
jgi:hypothetical protein